jgi:hypothetical protein
LKRLFAHDPNWTRERPSEHRFRVSRRRGIAYASNIQRLAAVSASLIAVALSIALTADPAQARQPGETGDVTIDQFATSDGGDKIVFRGVAFVKTSLDIDEVQELLAPSAPADHKLGMLKKLKADSISIASIEITPPDGVVLSFTGLQASNVDAAKIGKLSIAGIAGAFRDGGGRMAIKMSAATLEDADFSALLDCAGRGPGGAGLPARPPQSARG